jgi:hypothetical protein
VIGSKASQASGLESLMTRASIYDNLDRHNTGRLIRRSHSATHRPVRSKWPDLVGRRDVPVGPPGRRGNAVGRRYPANRVLARAENLDPETALAIVETPAVYSGVLDVDRNQLVDRALEAQHGEDVPKIEELESAIATAESAVEAGREEVAHENGIFDPVKFNELAADFEKGKAGPWLKKVRPRGRR